MRNRRGFSNKVLFIITLGVLFAALIFWIIHSKITSALESAVQKEERGTKMEDDDADDNSWRCDECWVINPKENTHCDGCEKKKTEEDEIVEISESKIPSSTKAL